MTTPPAPPAPPIDIRPLQTHEEFAACVALQKETWGASFSETVPPAILKVVQRIGGLAAGAFDGDGRLVGFVFGLTGVERGHLVHWSDMLAVRPEARDLGIGRRLKAYQREHCRRVGAEVIYWTYDPLVARNAFLNLERLGARVVEYVPDMYGPETDSPLHRGIGSDRFVVAWRTAEPSGTAHALGERVRGAREAPILNPLGAAPLPATTPVVRVEIPCDIGAVQSTSLPTAAAWRASTRAIFTTTLGRGYEVAGFYREEGEERCFYVLRNE
ncbi:MAG TPA: GNAT family N-acetyltransferase [Gemmatimonadaceae bacterium]|nr:GNAT family N-acetyltransferase [Gemmatimonadaceae bacterium]